MPSEIRIAQFFALEGTSNFYQNYFFGQNVSFDGANYSFAPFSSQGSSASLGGDNPTMLVLFPAIDFSLAMLESTNGNRLTSLVLGTQWLNANNAPVTTYRERYIGVGAAISDTTIELRFRSAMDSVGSRFPMRTLSRNLVGSLPLNAEISLR